MFNSLKSARRPISPFFFLAALAFTPSISFSQSAAKENALRAGLIHLYKKEIPKAVQSFESLAEGEGPSKAAALYYLGYSHYQGRDFTKAREAFQRSYETSPPYGVPTKEEPLDLEHTAATPDLSGPAMKTEVPSPNPHFKKGMYFLGLRNYDSASEEFRAAAEEDPSQAGFLYYNGYALYKLKKFSQAGEAFQEAFRLQPDYAPPSLK